MLAAIFIGVLVLLNFVYGSIIVYTKEPPHSIMEEFRDMPADFGPDLPLEGLFGYLVAGEPPDGCTNLTGPPTIDNFTSKWIVLISKYNCSYEQQIRNAQAAGFDCAIVHNVNSSELEVMTADDSDGINIPSVFISALAGEILTKQYLFTSDFYIMVNGDLPFNINTHLLLPFAVVVVLCLLVILIFMIVKCIKDRRRARRHRLPNRALLKIPTCKFTKGDPYETCAICLDDYQEGDRLRVLPCAHAYHAACIDPWLTQNKRVCPVCKRRVLAAGEPRRRSGSDSDTEPLLPDARDTQGGTFDEQSENPFARASRFMSRLRARPRQGDSNAEVTPPSEQNESNNVNEETGTSEVSPLLAGGAAAGAGGAAAGAGGAAAGAGGAAAVLVTVREQRGRRARRPRRARSAGAHRHSINIDTAGEIGVAALPASPQLPSHRPAHL